jgi:uncharacterized membrane protein
MRHFTFRPTLTIRGREFKGLRGYAGKPFHPPLTDIPVAAFLFAAVFDVTSTAIGASHPAARQLYVASGWLLLGGLAVGLLAALTGYADRNRSSEAGTQARRTINAHAVTMIAAVSLAAADAAVRYLGYSDHPAAPLGITVLSATAAAAVSFGATLGGTLVFDYGFNVETAADSPVWHADETDVFPGADHRPVAATRN